MPRHARLSLAAAALTALTIPLTACSSGANPADLDAAPSTFTASNAAPRTAATNPNANTSPSPGAVVSDDKAFNFVVPQGWNLSKNPQAITYLSSATVAHDVAPTIVVTRSNVSPAPALEEALQMSMLQSRQDGDSVTRLPDGTIGNEKSVSFTASGKEKNVDITRTYTLVAHDKKMYVITLTSASADRSATDATLHALLASWTWTKAGDKDSTASGTTPAAVSTSTSTPPSSSSSSSSSTSGSSSKSSSPTPSSSGAKSPEGAASSTSTP